MVVSVLGFMPWALAGRPLSHAFGEVGLYLACALVFIGVSGVMLHGLAPGPGGLGRFYGLFSLAFGLYAIAWIVGWMTVRGHTGGLLGLGAGSLAMAWVLTRGFHAKAQFVNAAAAIFVSNAAGYFAGGWVEAVVAARRGLHLFGWTLHRSERMMAAMLLWGVCYGLGLGAGLGVVFYYCRRHSASSATNEPRER